MPKAQIIPPGYHAVTPCLVVRNAARAIDFYKQAFGAAEILRIAQRDGRIAHAELRIGDSLILVSDEYPEADGRSPQSLGGSPVGLLLYVEDVDEIAGRAIAAGARVVRPVRDQAYGDRSGTLADPFGHTWHVATRLENVTPEQLRERAAAAGPS